jgi:hypothetical protein
MDAAAMTAALASVNNKIAAAAPDASGAIFFCECGDCQAEKITLSLDEYDQIRAREDLVFAPGHDAQRTYPGRHDIASGSPLARLIVNLD